MAGLLVSVRCAEEARAAWKGGASLIDVKEPAHGALGRASPATLSAVLDAVAGRCPVSAALGELLDSPELPDVSGLSYVKWGLAGCSHHADWRRRLTNAVVELRRRCSDCRVVAVAYADYLRAKAPAPDAVAAFAAEYGCGAMLLDTWRKDGSTLLDWLSMPTLTRLLRACRASRVPVALAGSLGIAEIRRLCNVDPDWFAVRGAACYQGERDQSIDPSAVRRLRDAATEVNLANAAS